MLFLIHQWDFQDGEAPKGSDRHFKCLEIFKRVLAEEESKMTGNHGKELSELIKWSEDSGAMWLHMLLSSGFFDSPSFPCMQLRRDKGAEWWDERIDEYGDTEEVETFVISKLDDLAAYDKVKDEVEHYKALIDSKVMTSEQFMSEAHRMTNDCMSHLLEIPFSQRSLLLEQTSSEINVKV